MVQRVGASGPRFEADEVFACECPHDPSGEFGVGGDDDAVARASLERGGRGRVIASALP